MGRNASEGLVLVHTDNDEVAVVEINSETDFVAKKRFFILKKFLKLILYMAHRKN